jgi:L-histidine N-alpha-methyltransferase
MPFASANARPGLTVENHLRKEAQSQIAQDVMRGLLSQQKSIPSKYFYDARGSRLFEQICSLPEYYQTRTEMSILRTEAEILTRGFENGDLVELGSGANWKIRTLLEAMGRSRRSHTRYVPIDVSETALISASRHLLDLYPELTVQAIVGDFTSHLPHLPSGRMKLLLFFGSTLGNLTKGESQKFLREVAATLSPPDRFLLGLDMVKPERILNAAYNDSQGITEQFNKNVLLVVNRELGANFDPDDFDHVAFFNPEDEQVEMHLRANRPVSVEILDSAVTVAVDEGETIHTEVCRKFTRQSATEMVLEAGMRIARWHSDPDEWFSIAEIVPAD